MADEIVFEYIGDDIWQTRSRSDPTLAYNVRLVSDDVAICGCRAAVQRGPNGCAHAQALVRQQSANTKHPLAQDLSN